MESCLLIALVIDSIVQNLRKKGSIALRVHLPSKKYQNLYIIHNMSH
jgi:hypothetical protein